METVLAQFALFVLAPALIAVPAPLYCFRHSLGRRGGWYLLGAAGLGAAAGFGLCVYLYRVVWGVEGMDQGGAVAALLLSLGLAELGAQVGAWLAAAVRRRHCHPC